MEDEAKNHTEWTISESCKHKFCGQCPFTLKVVNRQVLEICGCSCHFEIHQAMASVIKK